jgi:hypothetical protein
VIKFKTYSYTDNQFFQCEAFSMLVPEEWVVSGGIIWRQHATMPGAIKLSIRSSDGLYELNLHPSMPYFWGTKPVAFPFFGAKQDSQYMGNEIKRPVTGYLQYLQEYVLPKGGFTTRIVSHRKYPELENALRGENPGVFGMGVSVDGGIANIEYEHRGYLFEGDITCGIVTTRMMYNQTSWIADKIISTRAPKGKLAEVSKIFSIMLNSFKFNIYWFNCYRQLVQANTQYVMQNINNAGEISRIIRNAFQSVSETVKRSYEAQQASYDRVFKGISESIRGVNSYYDPYKGYNVQIPNGYRYVYSNPLGEYIVTDNPNYNPNVGSNLNWTNLNRV